jgi:hypothetical protein
MFSEILDPNLRIIWVFSNLLLYTVGYYQEAILRKNVKVKYSDIPRKSLNMVQLKQHGY